METVSSKKYSIELDIARKHLQEHLFNYCFMVEAPFSDLEEASSSESWYKLKDSAQLILTDPPYNIRRERGMENAEHEKLHLTDMEECAEIIDNMLRFDVDEGPARTDVTTLDVNSEHYNETHCTTKHKYLKEMERNLRIVSQKHIDHLDEHFRRDFIRTIGALIVVKKGEAGTDFIKQETVEDKVTKKKF